MRSSAKCDPVVLRELPCILQIFRDETWLEGERRGCSIPPGDPTVRETVCQVILRIGAQMRAAITAEIQRRLEPAGTPVDEWERERPASGSFDFPRGRVGLCRSEISDRTGRRGLAFW